jgi:hypothetical protein
MGGVEKKEEEGGRDEFESVPHLINGSSPDENNPRD